MLTLLLGFLIANAHAEAPLSKHSLAEVRQGELPAGVTKFAAALEKSPTKTKSFFSFPVEVHETSYQPFGESCSRDFTHRKAANMAELAPALKKLAAAFHTDPIQDLHDNRYGVAPDEHCSHVVSVRFDEAKSKITEISIDK